MVIAIIVLFVIVFLVIAWINSLATTYNRNGRILDDNTNRISNIEERLDEIEERLDELESKKHRK